MLKLDIDVLWTLIDLVILYVLLRKFLFKPVRNIIAKRSEEIADEYKKAEQKNSEADQLKAQYAQSQADIEKERLATIAEAKKDGQAEYNRIVKEAQAKSDAIAEDAKVRAQAAAKKEVENARNEIESLAKQAADKIVDLKANESIYDSFLGSVAMEEENERR